MSIWLGLQGASFALTISHFDHFDKARVPDCIVNNLGRGRVVDEGVIGARVQIPKRYCKCDSLDRSLGGLTVEGGFRLVSTCVLPSFHGTSMHAEAWLRPID